MSSFSYNYDNYEDAVVLSLLPTLKDCKHVVNSKELECILVDGQKTVYDDLDQEGLRYLSNFSI